MKSAICTLFEGDYHYGVGALTNSLYHYGFRGEIWVGYRGDLPPWSKNIKSEGRYDQYQVAEGCYLNFIKLDTNYHLTNYKPDFMLDLWENYCQNAESLFYFDPDIIVKSDWKYFEEWVSYGIALCEDVTSPVYSNHPLRLGWRKFYEPLGFKMQYETNLYVNGGFIGLTKDRQDFLVQWSKIQELMATEIGGLEKSNIGNQKTSIFVNQSGRNFLFSHTDQDALNITIMFNNFDYTFRGKEAMDIIPGGYTMSHAIGGVKPWRKKMLLSFFQTGSRPRLTDRLFWQFSDSPISLYSFLGLRLKQFDLFLASVFGRYLG